MMLGAASLVFVVNLGAILALLNGKKEKGSVLSSCSGSGLQLFHADDWFRCSEEGEEGSDFGLCPLITLHYRTGGIYHQTPKAAPRREHWNQSPRLHAIHPGPGKTELQSPTTSIFSVRGCSEEREQQARTLYEETLGYVLGKSPLFSKWLSLFLSEFPALLPALLLPHSCLNCWKLCKSYHHQLQAPEWWSEVLSHSCFYWTT